MTLGRLASALVLPPLAGVVVALAGCTGIGEIEGPGGSGAHDSGGSGSVGGSAAGQTATGGSTNEQPQARAGLDRGRVTMRRLNSTEYNNTVRDLLGTSLRPADAFPPDEVSDGFNTIGSTLAIPPSRLESYEAAAQSLVDELFELPMADARRKSVLSCPLDAGQEEACGEKILSGLMRGAFRRPPDAAEVSRFTQLAKTVRGLGANAEEGLKAAMRAVLMAPQFVFRIEKDSASGSVTASAVSDYELATRLSYFIWASMPDPELFAEADAGHLTQQVGTLTAQLDRMLASPKAASLAESFAGQWLGLPALATKLPSVSAFPAYDPTLLSSAATETKQFFEELLKTDAPIESLITADFSVIDGRLAKNYGVTASGQDFVRTSLSGTPRVGILGQASFLLGTSHPDRTSPVKRGAWVLTNLLCAQPPPPPQMVAELLTPTPGGGATLRQQLEKHRASPQCSGCHTLMDPIGLALENFDAIGQYRTEDNGVAIDARGTLPSGVMINGGRELAFALAEDPRYAPCVTQQLLTYAVGRTFDNTEAKAYAATVASDASGGGTFGWKAALRAVVSSEAFRTKRGEGP
jgi:hypothetical protein